MQQQGLLSLTVTCRHDVSVAHTETHANIMVEVIAATQKKSPAGFSAKGRDHRGQLQPMPVMNTDQMLHLNQHITLLTGK